MAAGGATVRACMNVHDPDVANVGVGACAYPVPDRVARGDTAFGRFRDE